MAGLIAWHELYTHDVEAATRFYSELLGAELEKSTMTEHEYPMLVKGGGAHAGFIQNDHPEVPSHWYPYIQVDDVDATVEQAKSLGAEVHHGPMDVGDALRIAVLGDPQDATVGVMTSSEGPPQGLIAWDELHAADADAAASFYGAITGWTTAPFMDEYRVFKAGETSTAGLMQRTRVSDTEGV